MRIAIIGCGTIGARRAQSLPGECSIAVCCDVEVKKAVTLSRQYPESEASSDWQATLERPDIAAVVVATTHNMLAPVTAAAAGSGKHVLVEKPCARSADELDCVIQIARRSGVRIRAGYNHRFHRALQKAREIFDSGALGPLMFIRGRYGHGGRPGYDKEWRSAPEISGGGEAIDQGVHLIDLARWFAGDFPHVQGHAGTYFWDMPVEDNCFFLLRTATNQVAFLHASWTEWKNLFSFEIYGRDGKLDIQGLGGSYGPERVAFYRMLPGMGPPETTIWEFPMPDDSWQREFHEFMDDIRLEREPRPGLEDARAALRIVGQLYEARS
jgi:predicted dehydrogenase